MSVVPENEKDMILILLAGQSNMAGRGIITAEDLVEPENVFYMGKDLQWHPAVEPITHDRPFVGKPLPGGVAAGGDSWDSLAIIPENRIVGVGLGRTFGILLSRWFPGRRIGLIPAAVGGTPVRCWMPGAADSHDEALHPYDDALKRARAAMKYGTLRAILWHQGESDASIRNPDYKEQLKTVIGNFRRELKAETVPFIMGELASFYQNEEIAAGTPMIDRAILEIAAEMPQVAVVRTKDLKHRGDFLHFDTDALHTLGARYFEQFRRMVGDDPGF